MFVRQLNKGKKSYFYVIQAYYDKKAKAPRQKRVADITGLPIQLINSIRDFLKGEKGAFLTSKELSGLKISASRLFGPLWICLHFWLELRMDTVFTDRKEFRRLTGMVLARVIAPESEMAMAKWLRKTALHLLWGGQESQWQREYFYPILTKLTQRWPTIEEHLWKHREKSPRLYLYDITSTYFEGTGGSLGALGYSRDEKRGNPQVVIALAADERGLPVAIRILRGNTKDDTTVRDSVKQLQQKYKAEKVTLVMDRGMRGEANLEALQKSDFDYIIALKHKEAREFLKTHNNELEWELFDQRSIAEWQEGEKRYVLCRNPQTAKRDRKTREKILSRAEKRLDGLVTMAEKGRIKNKEKILVRAVKILTQTKTDAYFTYTAEEGLFTYQRTDRVPLDEAYEGCYILETSLDKGISSKEIDDRYHTQHEVEEIFKACKDELKLRPNHHQKDENIAGHIYLTFLAYFVQRYLELKLMKNKCNEKAATFLARFFDICVNNVNYNGHSEKVLTQLDKQQSQALELLNITMPKGTVDGTLAKYLPKNIQQSLR
ncbi:MAG: IS1634 family transposase [Desulfobulbaceae bacterium]|nr:IS1634 family transposase [Desulfobulbaceae bacterium]